MSILLGRLAHSLGYALNHTALQVADQEGCIRLRRTKTHGKGESKNGANDNWIVKMRTASVGKVCLGSPFYVHPNLVAFVIVFGQQTV